ncbi:MAG: methyltransferase domain-containing protein [Burkholderiales bacterium]|nr:methyltransferase domain-containing protein [Burkholderiales bacterium]
MSDHIETYLRRFEPISSLDRSILLREMDAVWDEMGLDNSMPLCKQESKVARFYGHPVWVLNGLFSEVDPMSRKHREAIADYLSELKPRRIADYGGGSGVLARFIVQRCHDCVVDVVEPFPSPFVVSRMAGIERVQFVAKLEPPYDAIVVQDVLEHVDDPLELAFNVVDATRQGGCLVFANSFWPEIKCHMPSTFYLRYHFSMIMRAAGLKSLGCIADVGHSEVFSKVSPANRYLAGQVASLAKVTGPIVNRARGRVSAIRRAVSRTREASK